MKIRQLTTTILLADAKQLIDKGEMSLREAAEKIAAAQESGATQRQIAVAVGKSAAWVNRLLQWRQGGYAEDTAFGAVSQASRERSKRVHSTEQASLVEATEQDGAAHARAQSAHVKTTRIQSKPRKQSAEAAKADADARERAKEQARRSLELLQRPASESKPFQFHQREHLVKVLETLGSAEANERDNAARAAEELRKTLDMSWDDLIIRSNDAPHPFSRRTH